DALDRTDDLLRPGHPRDAVVAHERDRLDTGQPRARQPVHQLPAHRGLERLGLVLQAVPRPDVAQGYPHRESVVIPEATAAAAGHGKDMHPSASFSATIRVRIANHPGAFARLAATIGEAGGLLG